MACRSFSFPISNNATLEQQFQQNFLQAFDVAVDSTVLDSSSFLSTLYCASDTALQCYGICPNADLAGVGVRIAFWVSSILQAILVTVSPEDSSQGAWTAAVLTASVTIPALIQKRLRQLSIYHATLVLNFATFSSIVSLAVAPMCTVWRHSNDDGEDPRRLDAPAYPDHPTFAIAVFGEEGRTLSHESEPLTNLPKQKVHRQRLVLSLALLTQVALQWAWSISLFTDPEYYQKACIPNTMVVIFGRTLSVGRLNHELFLIWPMWLLFNLAITLVWGILLVYSSSPSVHPVLSRQPSLNLIPTWRDKLPVDKGRITVISTNVIAFLIALLFLVSSEVQVVRNCVHDENSNWSFGQIAAILVACVILICSVFIRTTDSHEPGSLAPAWAIATAFEHRQGSERQPGHHDAETNSMQNSGSQLDLTPTEGTNTPFEDKTENCEVVIVEATEPVSSSNFKLTVPQRDIFRQRTSHGPPPIS